MKILDQMAHRGAIGTEGRLVCSPVRSGEPGTIGDGFTVEQFRHTDFSDGAMSPFVLVDHFTMWRPTFDEHPHAGMSAVTLVFEDTKGEMVSVDSTGHRAVLGAGDLHWTLAGRGIVHTQLPADPDTRIHALQIFVNLPALAKGSAPDSFAVSAGDMPALRAAGARIRIVAGELQGSKSPATTPQPVLMLDGHLRAPHDPVSIPLPDGWNAWVYAVEGRLGLGDGRELAGRQALCVSARDGAGALALHAHSDAHFVLLAGPRIDEPVVQRGPFVLESEAALADAIARYQAGAFGRPRTSN